MPPIINKNVEFKLLPSNEVLVSVAVSVGEPGCNDITTVARQRLSCDEFCAKALPIMYQNYNSWPPNDIDAAKVKEAAQLTQRDSASNPDEPADELQPPDAEGIRRRFTKGIPGG